MRRLSQNDCVGFLRIPGRRKRWGAMLGFLLSSFFLAKHTCKAIGRFLRRRIHCYVNQSFSVRILLFNLATDSDDPILGFTTRWIKALAKHVERIHVITMRV